MVETNIEIKNEEKSDAGTNVIKEIEGFSVRFFLLCFFLARKSFNVRVCVYVELFPR